MICPQCQTDNRADAKFCNECGFDLRTCSDAVSDDEASTLDTGDVEDAPSEHGEATSDAATPPEVIDAALHEVKSLSEVVPPIIKVPAIVQLDETDPDGAAPSAASSGAQGESVSSQPGEEDPCAAPASEGKSAQRGDASEQSAAEGAGEGVVRPSDQPTVEFKEASPDSVYAEAQAMFGSREIPDAEVTADLTGLERLVDSSYVPPVVSGRAGDTMQLPRIEEDITPRAQSFRAQVDRKELRRQKKEQRRLQREQEKRERELRKQGAVPLAPDVRAASGDKGAESAEPGFLGSVPEVIPAEAPSSHDAPKSSRKGPIIGLIALIAVIVVVIVGATYYLELWGGKSVPDVAGKSLADARYVLEEQGFETSVEQVKSDDVEGLVLETDPSANARAEQGSLVTIYVAMARVVPNVTGKTQAEIEDLMEAEGFKNVTYEFAKSNEVEGTGINVEPASGEKALAGDAIVVTLAQAYTVPDVAGKSSDEATALLEAEGYVVTTEQYNTEDYAEGTAVSTDPVAGSKHPTGGSVTLYLAHNRSTELVDLTRAFFSATPLMTIGGVVYRLDATSLQLSYAGDNTVSFTVSGTEVGFIFGIAVDNPSGAQSIAGTVTWDDDNNIVSTYPVMRQGA